MFTKPGLSIHLTSKHSVLVNGDEKYKTVTKRLNVILTRELTAIGVKPGDTVEVSIENKRIIIIPSSKK